MKNLFFVIVSLLGSPFFVSPSFAEGRLAALTLGRVLEHCNRAHSWGLRASQFHRSWNADTPLVEVISESTYETIVLDPQQSPQQHMQWIILQKCLADFGLTLGLNDQFLELADSDPHHWLFDRISRMPTHNFVKGLRESGSTDWRLATKLARYGYFILFDLQAELNAPPQSSGFSASLTSAQRHHLMADLREYARGRNFTIDLSSLRPHLSQLSHSYLRNGGSHRLIQYKQLRARVPGDVLREVELADDALRARADLKFPNRCQLEFLNDRGRVEHEPALL